jgi:hypothetical protein
MTLRPATAEERRALERLEGSSVGWSVLGAAWFAVSIAIAGLGLFFLGTKSRPVAQAFFVFAVGVASAVMSVYLRRLFARSAASARAAAASDAGAAQVDESTFAIVDAIQVPETEDEGLHFFLRLVDGRVLFLSGQYLYEAVEEGRFPSSRVTVVRAPSSEIVLDFTPTGDYLAPTTVRAPFSDDELARDRVPGDGAILRVAFDTLRTAPL